MTTENELEQVTMTESKLNTQDLKERVEAVIEDIEPYADRGDAFIAWDELTVAVHKIMELIAQRTQELEKLLLMIVEKGQLDFNEEGWAFYDKVVGRIDTTKVNNKQQEG